MINYKKLDVVYDQVVFIDLLSDHERNEWKITKTIDTTLKSEGYSTRVINLSTKKELFDALAQLTTESIAGKRYMLHFVGHGNNNCIGFKHKHEIIPWSELEEPLQTLNVASNESLVLNMTTCKGLNVIKAVDHLSTTKPFFGIIGYSDDLEYPIGIHASEIFYKGMSNGMEINEVLIQVQKETNDNKFHCITAQGYSQLKTLSKL
jgi:hypothetical protein